MQELKKNYFIRNWLREVDQQIVATLVVLIASSMILVATAGPAVASRIGLYDNYFVSKQIVYLAIASIILLVFSFIDQKWIKRISIFGFLFSILMLIFVKFYGYEIKGATRWIRVLGFSYQPSEFIKPFFSVVVGWVLSLKYQEDIPSFTICFILYLIVAGLLVIQPDFGMLVLITIMFSGQIFVAGIPVIWIAISSFIGGSGVFFAYILLPHVALRINNFLDPANNENYQVGKSLLAFQHGGFYGVGPGEGSVKQYLPDSHSDFIFAVAGEEFGAIICLMLLFAFSFIVIKTLVKLKNEDNKFIQLASIGLILQFGLQATINIGVTLNLLPTKGMTLPFISYGGSSTFAMAVTMGMLLGLTRRRTSLTRYKLSNISY